MRMNGGEPTLMCTSDAPSFDGVLQQLVEIQHGTTTSLTLSDRQREAAPLERESTGTGPLAGERRPGSWRSVHGPRRPRRRGRPAVAGSGRRGPPTRADAVAATESRSASRS